VSGGVLVVEDDEDILENVRLLLVSEGFRVDVALNGRAALDALVHADPLPRIILLDLNMPVMNGFAFRKAQLADPRIAAVPIVLMTADGHLIEKTARLGAASALRKPFDIDDLVRVVGRFAK